MSGDRCWSSIAATPAEHAALGDPPGASWLIMCRLVSGHSGPHASDGVNRGTGRRRWLLWSDFAERPQSLIDHDPCAVPELDGAECVFFAGHGGPHRYPLTFEPPLPPGPAADPRPLAEGGGNPFGFAAAESHGRHQVATEQVVVPEPFGVPEQVVEPEQGVEPEPVRDPEAELAAAQAAFNSAQGGFGGLADDESTRTYRPGFLAAEPSPPTRPSPPSPVFPPSPASPVFPPPVPAFDPRPAAPVTIGTWSGEEGRATDWPMVEVVNPPVRDPLAAVPPHPLPRVMTVGPDGLTGEADRVPRYLGRRHARHGAAAGVVAGDVVPPEVVPPEVVPPEVVPPVVVPAGVTATGAVTGEVVPGDAVSGDDVAAEVEPVLEAAHQVTAAAQDAAARLESRRAPQLTARRLGSALREVAVALEGLADALDPRG